ncbi:hypothetical protein HDU79_009926 [Rhizoclosmatium sp. JEL0117]|nr:hypothetical protein HDU79_009926 [Rhizoclosmatium sp. JEL0117]
MGKHNNRPARHLYKRANPIYSSRPNQGNESAETGQEGETVSTSNLSSLLKDQIVPIVKKLSSEKPDEKSWAAAAVSNLLLDDSSRLQLLKAGISKVLVDRITAELDISVRVDLCGATANLALFGGDDVAKDLVRKGCVQAVLSQLAIVSDFVAKEKHEYKGASGSNKDAAAQFELRKNTLLLFEQCVSVLWALSDASLEGLTLASKDPRIVDLLMKGITLAESDFQGCTNKVSLAIVSAQCLNTLTEENKPIHAHLHLPTSTTHIQTLTAIAVNSQLPPTFTSPTTTQENLSESILHLRILATSILANLSLLPVSKTAAVVADAISWDLDSLCSHVVTASRTGVSQSGELTTAGERVLDAATSVLGALQTGLEVLANAYSEEYAPGEEEEEEVVDGEWGDEEMDEEGAGEEEDDDGAFDQMMEDQELAAQMAAESGGAGGDGDDSMETAGSGGEDRAALVEKLHLIQKILNVSAAGSRSEINTIASSSPVYSAVDLLGTVRVRAFGCLQNILTCLASTKKWYSAENAVTVHQLWATLFEAAHSAASSGSNSTSNLETIESAVSAIWALARGVDEYKGTQKIILNPTQSHLQNLIQTASLPTPTPSLALKCTATLGLLAKSTSTNATIGPFLMSTIQNPNTHVDVVSEALNAVYDVYGDAVYPWDSVFVNGKYLDVLRGVLPGFKAKVKGVDKRRERGVRERAEEALLNLGAFIKYKEGEALEAKKKGKK